MEDKFLPLGAAQAKARGWDELDFVMVSGDAYVDHPSFGAAILGRLLEDKGYRVGMLAQPDFKNCESFKEYGRPRYGFFISGGVVDSMVAHYSVAKRRRGYDEYTPGGKAGVRPDRVIDVYSRLAKQAYPDVPVVVGGLEASLRRFAHYDYWEDAVRPSSLVSSGADMISFGMGERSIAEIARRLAAGEDIASLRDIHGTAYLCDFSHLPQKYVECASYAKVKADKTAYAKACRIQMENQDPVSALPVVQKQSVYSFEDEAQKDEGGAPAVYLVQNLPAQVLSRAEFDAVYELPYTRRWHPAYDALGGVPALEEVEFSLIHNRGCFGGCNFCAITMHQGRRVTSRSADSVVREAQELVKKPGFKGYIHDVGGPTANFRAPSCAKQITQGGCKGARKCLAPSPCPNLVIDHSGYLAMLRRIRVIPGVKKVFIRSGIRYDYLVNDKDDSFFKELVKHHVSGQLKVAPEHCAPGVLRAMGKPPIEVYNRFAKKFYALSDKAEKKQYLVPYLISSHPGSTLKDAVALAEYLKDNRIKPEQVQDFYPTPGTVSTCMYYTGLDPYTLNAVVVARDGEHKAMQRALLQAHDPKNAGRVKKALRLCHREDLAGKLLGGKQAAALRKASGGAADKKDASRNQKSGQDTVQHGAARGKPGRGTQSDEKKGAKDGRAAGRGKTGRKQASKGRGR